MSVLEMSSSSYTYLTAETYLWVTEFLQIAVNWEDFLILRRRTRITVISKKKKDGQNFKPNTQKKENVLRENFLLCRA
jgi:hypothetical protein